MIDVKWQRYALDQLHNMLDEAIEQRTLQEAHEHPKVIQCKREKRGETLCTRTKTTNAH